MLMEKRRYKYSIISEIAEIAENGALKTQILDKANLNTPQRDEYFNLMLKSRLLEKTIENGREIYKTTNKGLKFQEKYREITGLLSENPIEQILVYQGDRVLVKR